MTQNFLVGHGNLATRAGAAFEGDPGGAVIADAGAGFEGTNLGDVIPYTYWKSPPATSAIDLALVADRRRQVGLLGLLGDNLSERAVVQAVSDERWAWRWGLQFPYTGTNNFQSASDLDTADLDDATYECWARFDVDLRGSLDSTRNGAASILIFSDNGWNASDMEFSLEVNGGRWRATFFRRGGVPVALIGSVVEAGKWTHLAVVIDGAGVLGRLYIDGVSAGSVVLPARATESATMYVRCGHGPNSTACSVTDVRVWHRALPAQEILDNRAVVLAGDEDDLHRWWPIDDGSGTSVREVVEGVAGSASGTATWVPVVNPLARFDSGVIDRWQGWRRRENFRILDRGMSWQTTSGTLTTRPEVTVSTWLRVDQRVEVGTGEWRWVCSYGTTVGGTGVDWQIILGSDAAEVSLRVSRYDAASLDLVGPDVRGTGWRHVVATISDVDQEAWLYVDGTPYGPLDIATLPYVHKTDQEFTIGDAGPPGTVNRLVGVDVGGDLLVYGRVVPIAEAEAWKWRRVGLVPGVRLRYEIEEGTTLANTGEEGAAGDLTIVGDAAKIAWGERVSEDPTGVWLAGDVVDYQHNGRGNLVIPANPATACSRVLFRLHDPDNPDGQLSAGIMFAGEITEPKHGATGLTEGSESPDFERSEAGMPYRGSGVFSSEVSVDVSFLTEDDREALRHHLDRLGARGVPVLVVGRTNHPLPWRLDATVYGRPKATDTVYRRVLPAGPATRRVVVLEIPTS